MRMEPIEDQEGAPSLDGGPRGRRGASERTCILHRRAVSPERLMRFVLGPGDVVVPDLKARLPGRGAWLTASRAALEEAVRRKAFARAFRKPVAVPGDLAERVDRLLEGEALAALSLANKAGKVVTGFAKVEAALAGGEVACLVHASDGAEDGARKLLQAAHRQAGGAAAAMRRVGLFTSMQLDLALGRMNVVHAALLAGGPSTQFLARCTALEVFRTADAAGGALPTSVNEPKH